MNIIPLAFLGMHYNLATWAELVHWPSNQFLLFLDAQDSMQPGKETPSGNPLDIKNSSVTLTFLSHDHNLHFHIKLEII